MKLNPLEQLAALQQAKPPMVTHAGGNVGMPPDALPPAAPAPATPPAAPFANIASQIPTSSFTNPAAQSWLQQALAGPYMPGWGGVNTQGMPAGSGMGSKYTDETGKPKNILVSDLEVGADAAKIGKGYRKMKRSQGWSAMDIGKLVGSVALGVATGGSSLAGQVAAGALAGGTGIMGKQKADKAMGMSMKKFDKLRKQYLPQYGITKSKGAWYDSAGNRVSHEAAAQILMDLGAFG